MAYRALASVALVALVFAATFLAIDLFSIVVGTGFQGLTVFAIDVGLCVIFAALLAFARWRLMRLRRLNATAAAPAPTEA
jgi:hypothetical protein